MSDFLALTPPERCGLPSGSVLLLLDAMARHEFHNFVLTANGFVVAAGAYAPYTMACTPMVFSCSKNFTATAVGLAVDQGLFGLEDPLVALFPEFAPPEISPLLARLTVHDCLCMATGHTTDTTRAVYGCRAGDGVAAFLAQPIEKPPGTHFLYNTGSTYTLGRLVEKVSGTTLQSFLAKHLFAPLGIHDARFETTADGHALGGSGLHISVEGLAKLGLLYASDGVWQGRRLLSADWCARAVAAQVGNHHAAHITSTDGAAIDWGQGYGYQFWRCRHDGYRGDGAYGQFNLVMPRHNLTFASTGVLPRVMDMQEFLDDFYDILLPVKQQNPLPENSEAFAALRARLASLSMPAWTGTAKDGDTGGARFVPQTGVAAGADTASQAKVASNAWLAPLAKEIEGVPHACASNPVGLTAFTLANQGILLNFGEQSIDAPLDNQWHTQEVLYQRFGQTAIKAAWLDHHTLRVQLRPLDFVQSHTLNICFSPNVEVRFTSTTEGMEVPPFAAVAAAPNPNIRIQPFPFLCWNEAGRLANRV